MHYTYIIYSEAANRFYVGETAFPESRLVEHNSGKYVHASTKVAKDWRVRLLIGCQTRSDAMKVEKYIKSMKSRKFTEQLVTSSPFFEKFKQIILERYSFEII